MFAPCLDPIFVPTYKNTILIFYPAPAPHSLVTPDYQAPFFGRPVPLYEAPGKSSSCMSFRELWALLSSLIGDAILLEDSLDRRGLAIEVIGYNDFCVSIL